jgi:hypothetical protein
MSSILAYKKLLRLKWGPLALTLVSILLVLMVTGVLASVQNNSIYSTEEIARSLPLHYTVSLHVAPVGGDLGRLVELHREMVGLGERLGVGIADNVVVLVQASLGNMTEVGLPGLEGGAPQRTPAQPILVASPVKPTIGSLYGGMAGVRVVEGYPAPGSLGLNDVLVKSGLGEGLLRLVEGLGVRFNDTYTFTCDMIPPCPPVLLEPVLLEHVILSNPRGFVELRYTYMVNFSLGAFTVLAPESVAEASREYEGLVSRVLEDALGVKLFEVREGMGGFVRITVTRSQEVDYRGLTVRITVTDSSSVLASTISAFSGAFILVSAFIFSLTLPVVVTSWILARAVGELVAYDVRRFVALGLIRGLPLRSFTVGFALLSLTVSALAVITSLPLLRVLVEVTARLAMGRVYYTPPLLDVGYVLSAVFMAFTISAVVYLKVRGVLRVIDLTQASRSYLQAEHGSWRPSTSLTILFALSSFKYVLWLTGTSATELVRLASGVHPLLTVLAVFYVLVDFFIGFIAPVVIPYYLTLLLLSREGFMRWVTGVTAGVVGGGLGYLVGSAIPRVSPRFSSLTASITLTLSFVAAAAIIRASVSEWYNVNSPVLAGRADFGSTFFNVMALSMMFYSYTAFTLLSGFILISSVMVGYTLFKSLERELAILKTRGVPLGGLVRFTYAQVLALTLVSILLSPLGIISAKGFVETFGSVFSGPLTARGLTPLSLTIDSTGVLVVLLGVSLSLIAPLVLLTHMSRRLSIELVSRV